MMKIIIDMICVNYSRVNSISDISEQVDNLWVGKYPSATFFINGSIYKLYDNDHYFPVLFIPFPFLLKDTNYSYSLPSDYIGTFPNVKSVTMSDITAVTKKVNGIELDFGNINMTWTDPLYFYGQANITIYYS